MSPTSDDPARAVPERIRASASLPSVDHLVDPHVSMIVAEQQRLADLRPNGVRRPPVRAFRRRRIVAAIAIAAVVFGVPALAMAGGLPGPVQRFAAAFGDAIGVDVPRASRDGDTVGSHAHLAASTLTDATVDASGSSSVPVVGTIATVGVHTSTLELVATSDAWTTSNSAPGHDGGPASGVDTGSTSAPDTASTGSTTPADPSPSSDGATAGPASPASPASPATDGSAASADPAPATQSSKTLKPNPSTTNPVKQDESGPKEDAPAPTTSLADDEAGEQPGKGNGAAKSNGAANGANGAGGEGAPGPDVDLSLTGDADTTALDEPDAPNSTGEASKADRGGIGSGTRKTAAVP